LWAVPGPSPITGLGVAIAGIGLAVADLGIMVTGFGFKVTRFGFSVPRLGLTVTVGFTGHETPARTLRPQAAQHARSPASITRFASPGAIGIVQRIGPARGAGSAVSPPA
jgi:hypothetical protein